MNFINFRVEQQLQELTQQSSNTERSNDILDEEFVDVVRKCVAFVGENKDCLKDLMIKVSFMVDFLNHITLYFSTLSQRSLMCHRFARV